MRKLNNVRIDRGVLNITVDSVQYAVLPSCKANIDFINKLQECENVMSTKLSDDGTIIIKWYDGYDDNLSTQEFKVNDKVHNSYNMVLNTLT